MRRIAWASLLVVGSAAVALEEIACKQVSVASLDPDAGPDAAPTPPGLAADAGDDATTSVDEAGGPACGQSVVQAGFDDLDGGVTADFASATVAGGGDGGLLTVTGTQTHDGTGALHALVPSQPGYEFLEVPIETPLAPGDHCVRMTFFLRIDELPAASDLFGPGIVKRDPSSSRGAVYLVIQPGSVPSLAVAQRAPDVPITSDTPVGALPIGDWHHVGITITTSTGDSHGNIKVFLDELPPLETPLAVDLTAAPGDGTSLVARLGITVGSVPADLYLDDLEIDVGH